ncbi:MAG: Bug family tripartite tricarboxylate transporter substrate binding protein [Roseovarius sp.]
MNLLEKTLAALGFACAMAATPAQAEYPSQPVTLVVPYGPGGAADLTARMIAKHIPPYLDGEVLVVNQTGAAGVTGSTMVAKGQKRGYNLLMGRVGSQAAVPAMNETIPYTWDEFTMLGLVETNPFTVVVAADSPYQTFEELVAALQGGERLRYASAGVGTLQHMGALIMLDHLGVSPDSVIHVPFKGGGEATTSVVTGNTDFVFNPLAAALGPIESGQMRALVITTPERVDAVADIPTASETGHPQLETVIGWSGVWGPGDLDAEAETKWIEALDKLGSDEEWLAAMEKLGSIPRILSPEETRTFVEKQYNAFRAVADKLDMIVR